MDHHALDAGQAHPQPGVVVVADKEKAHGGRLLPVDLREIFGLYPNLLRVGPCTPSYTNVVLDWPGERYRPDPNCVGLQQREGLAQPRGPISAGPAPGRNICRGYSRAGHPPFEPRSNGPGDPIGQTRIALLHRYGKGLAYIIRQRIEISRP